MKSHGRSLGETLLGTAFFVLGAFFLRWRAKTEAIGPHDTVIFLGCVVAGLLIGYRDRIPLLTKSTREVIRARLSGSSRGE